MKRLNAPKNTADNKIKRKASFDEDTMCVHYSYHHKVYYNITYIDGVPRFSGISWECGYCCETEDTIKFINTMAQALDDVNFYLL